MDIIEHYCEFYRLPALHFLTQHCLSLCLSVSLSLSLSLSDPSLQSSQTQSQQQSSISSVSEHKQQGDTGHCGGKAFHCEHCGKGFRQSNDLKRHECVHTGEKPFSCTLCDKRFTQAGSLKAHQRVHTAWLNYLARGCSQLHLWQFLNNRPRIRA